MSRGPNLEQRYRRVLRLLPGYYRDTWEEDMVAAFMESSLTGDRDEDEWILEFSSPPWREVASVAGLAVRLYLGGNGAPRRYFAWGQAVRRAVLTVMLVHAVRSLSALVLLAWTHRLFSSLPAPSASLLTAPPGGVWPVVWEGIDCAWIVVFVALVLGHKRTARVVGVLAIIPVAVELLQIQFTAIRSAFLGAWAYWVLLDVAPLLALAAFHRDAPPTARRPWLLALPAGYLLVAVPVLAVQATGNAVWLPDFSGLCCILVSLGCLARAFRVWSRRPPDSASSADSGVWSLTLILLAAVAGAYRIASLTDYPHDPHLITVSLAELLILAAAAALVARDAARTQAAVPAPPPRPLPG